MAFKTERSWISRAQPPVGSLLLALGFVQGGLLLARGGGKGPAFQMVIAALGLLAAGAGMIKRSTSSGAKLAAWAGASLAAAAAVLAVVLT